MPHSFFHHRGSAAVFAILCIALTTTVRAQETSGPSPVPLLPLIPPPSDTPYPGTISLLVDASNVTGRVLNVHEMIPVKGRDINAALP
jgi:hypothetical protein